MEDGRDASAGTTDRRTGKATVFSFPGSRALTLQNWPVSWRLFAVIVLTLVMGLVFGGLRVAAAADSAAQFGRVSQLASLGQQVTGLTQDLQNERDETSRKVPVDNAGTLQRWYDVTNAAAAKVQALAAGVGGSFPANIQAKVATVRSAITGLGQRRDAAQASQSVLAVIADYAIPIGDMNSLNDQIGQGTNDSALTNDVQTLNSLALEKDQAAQQRAILFNAFTQGFFANGEQQALITVVAEQGADATAFGTTATPAEQRSFNSLVAGPLVKQEVAIEDYVISTGRLDIGTGALNISAQDAPGQWYSSMSGEIDDMQAVELRVAGNIVVRAQVLQRGAVQSAVLTAILTAAILLLVLIATFAVARSLVRPLRRLQAAALDIATVQLPERVRQLGEATDPAESVAVTPIDVLSTDEIGQVARAFDQVHSEAVRLAGNEAMLRSSFNAMFVNLSRRSQSLIERLARMIDGLEQNEQDPDRLSSLFTMDHLVTRMRRNSENLLLLSGHEGARKWSEPVLLADVARAAASEIEQYPRVAVSIQPGIAVSGSAVSDVTHLLAEIIENATVFSPKDSQVHVSGRELASGGVLMEVSDGGVGVSGARLAEINSRLDNPPVIDASVARHMGLFAVARLAERHGVRVRLRAGSPGGLTAMVWLPESITERGARPYGGQSQRLAAQGGVESRRTLGRHSSATEGQIPNHWPDAGAAATPAGPGRRETVPAAGSAATPAGPAGRETVPAAGSVASTWFRNPRLSETVPAGPGTGPSQPAPPAADGWLSGAGDWAVGQHAAQVIADPVRGGDTAAGLPTRVPRANLIPGSAGGAAQADGRVSDQAAGNQARTPTALPVRSPELARSRLSGFQRGARRAEGQATAPNGEQIVELRIPSGPELADDRLHRSSRGCRACGRGIRGRRTAGDVGGRPGWFRRTVRGYRRRAGQPDARRCPDPRGRPAHAGTGGDGGRADAGQGDQRRLQPRRPSHCGMRHGTGLL
jgi:signal transduction histidine kinase